ncbi:hypothetical protein AMECASPLE_028497 [Ameca splendens]|uniref:Uncharacterized protein n=1 Tax=Ameca splendens TaxID=208324 RepID=A0ABV0YGY1_9TELE
MVLDLLTASVGGVCALLIETCCTYIPDKTNGEDGHTVTPLSWIRFQFTSWFQGIYRNPSRLLRTSFQLAASWLLTL